MLKDHPAHRRDLQCLKALMAEESCSGTDLTAYESLKASAC